jgi:hypothetical protein
MAYETPILIIQSIDKTGRLYWPRNLPSVPPKGFKAQRDWKRKGIKALLSLYSDLHPYYADASKMLVTDTDMLVVATGDKDRAFLLSAGGSSMDSLRSKQKGFEQELIPIIIHHDFKGKYEAGDLLYVSQCALRDTFCIVRLEVNFGSLR